MWPFKKKPSRFIQDGTPAEPLTVLERIQQLIPGLGVFPEFSDERYWQLSERDMKSFVWKYHKTVGLEYEAGVFDCDDFVLFSRMNAVQGQVKEKLPAPILWGSVNFVRKSGQAHAVNMTVSKEGNLMVYDPQTRGWSNGFPRDMDYIRSIGF